MYLVENFIHLFTFCLGRTATNLYETQNLHCQKVKRQVNLTRMINLKKTHITPLYRKSVGSCKICVKTDFVHMYNNIYSILRVSLILFGCVRLRGDALLAVFALCKMNEEKTKIYIIRYIYI